MSISYKLPEVTDLKPRISVIGVGGAGCNAINNIIDSGLKGADFISANTDAQALKASRADYRLQLGAKLTAGLGSGANPQIGQQAAEEAIDEIRSHISGSHMVFLAAGMGGGTGTGAVPVIAKMAREMDILTVAIISKPFYFEGARRMRIADVGIEVLRECVDTLIVIPNQNLFHLANEKTTFAEAFIIADQILQSGVACIVDLIMKEGHINLDFADVRTVMKDMGTAVMGTGKASGQDRATKAAKAAISNPLLEDISLRDAQGLLVSIVGGNDVTLFEVDEAASFIKQQTNPDANIIIGATFEENVEDFLRVSIVASGFPSANDSSLIQSSQSKIEKSLQKTQQELLVNRANLSPDRNTNLNSDKVPNRKEQTVSNISTKADCTSTSRCIEERTNPTRPPALPLISNTSMNDDPNICKTLEDEFARALSEVIGNSDENIKQNEINYQEINGNYWESTDGIKFVDGFEPAFSNQQLPAKSTCATSKLDQNTDFNPVPPEKSRRLLPKASDFPQIAQRTFQDNAVKKEGQFKSNLDVANILKRLAGFRKQLN
ncbi:MAG: Cell division protein FtsZ [Hyphomicrobiaceae bacterium hypho_1]